MPTGSAAARFASSLALQGVAVVALCVLVYWLRLGHSGLSSSEGFRAIPAWSMLDDGDWLVTRLFEQPYLRKPPGIVWSIAIASELLGRTELAARSVSAGVMSLGAVLVLVAGTRWFGKPWGFFGAAAFACSPMLWVPGRSAEIEALHTVFALGAAVGVIAAIRKPGGTRHAICVAAIGASVGGMMLTKGPAAFPMLGSLLAASSLVMRSFASLRVWSVWAGMIVGGAVFGAWAYLLQARVVELGISPVREGARFMWRPGHEWEVLLLIPTALGAMLPWSISLPFALRPAGVGADAASVTGRTIALGVALSLTAYAVLGIDNSRYTMPATALVPFAYAAALRRFSTEGSERWRRAGRSVFLGVPWFPVLGMLAMAVGYCQWYEGWRHDRHSGRAAGWELGGVLPDGALVVGDEMIDTRPEVFWYAVREAGLLGKHVRVVWTPGLADREAPPGTWVVFRDDSDPRIGRMPEWPIAERRFEHRTPVHRGSVHKFTFRVYAP